MVVVVVDGVVAGIIHRAEKLEGEIKVQNKRILIQANNKCADLPPYYI
jgi:hypothetical protein